MEHSIGVGIIVGLTFASSAYIWNSNNFSKEQKTILLVFLVFPPLQWVATLLVSIYNTNRENSTVEKVAEKKLDSTIANLTDLKQKGILSENEYTEKVTKIEQEKSEHKLINSIEYKQLKSLFESGVLTKKEFENKTITLKNSLKDTAENIQTVYRVTTENKKLKIVSKNYKTIGAKVYIEDKIAPNGSYNYKDKYVKLVVEDGKIKHIYFIEFNNKIYIEKKEQFSISVGDNVYLKSEEIAPNGEYSMGFMASKIIVENGKILKI